WTRFCLHACAFAGGIAQENLRAIMAPRIFAPTLVGHGAGRGRTSSGGREKAPSTQNPLEPSAPTLNPVPNHISFRVTPSPGHKRLTKRCSEVSGGVAFSDHSINFGEPVR